MIDKMLEGDRDYPSSLNLNLSRLERMSQPLWKLGAADFIFRDLVVGELTVTLFNVGDTEREVLVAFDVTG